MTQREKGITAGPGKFDLMNALFIGAKVTFTLEGGEKVLTQINKVEAEDGSRESWNLQGYIMNGRNEKFRGYYSTRGNKGHFMFE